MDEFVQKQVDEYLKRAHRALKTGRLALDDDDYIAAVNRAYYAIFYAANALLATKGLERSIHSGVIAAFREHFVKTGLIEAEYSRLYGATMDDRHIGDYSLEELGYEKAKRDLEWAERLVKRIKQALQDLGIP
jgi:uncharacterized protein (UPF0332 family)